LTTDLAAAILALLSSLAYGGGDFSGGVATRRSSVYAVIILSQGMGWVLYLALAALTNDPVPPLEHIIFGILGGLIGAVGLVALYTSLSRGNAGLTAPISGVLTASIPAGVGIATEGLPSISRLIGFALGLIAVWFVSRPPDGAKIAMRDLGRALLLPFIGGTAFGVGFLFFARAAEISTYYPLLAARTASVIMLTVFALMTKRRITPHNASALPLILVAGVLDASANLFFVLSANTGRIDIAAVLSSLFPAVTVLLAAIFLRERIGRMQWIGLAFTLTAIVLIVA